MINKLFGLVENSMNFVDDQLRTLPTHEHGDPVLKRMETDMIYFLEETQNQLDGIRKEMH
jgi:hypothetical protein